MSNPVESITTGLNHSPLSSGASLVAQMVKNLPAMQETQVQSLGGKIPWRRKWQSTPVFLPGESHGQRSLAAGYIPQSHKDLDTTEQLAHIHRHMTQFLLINKKKLEVGSLSTGLIDHIVIKNQVFHASLNSA